MKQALALASAAIVPKASAAPRRLRRRSFHRVHPLEVRLSLQVCRGHHPIRCSLLQRSGTNGRPSDAGVLIIVSRLFREIRTSTRIGRQIGKRRKQLRGHAYPQRLRMQLADGDGAEQIGAGQHPPRPPGGEDHQRQRDPAAAGRHVLDPLRRVDERQVAAGQPGAGAAEHHGEIADADDVDAERMRRAVVVADRAQRQARRAS